MCPPVVPGIKEGLSIKPAISTAAGTNNSTINHTTLQDSVLCGPRIIIP